MVGYKNQRYRFFYLKNGGAKHTHTHKPFWPEKGQTRSFLSHCGHLSTYIQGTHCSEKKEGGGGGEKATRIPAFIILFFFFQKGGGFYLRRSRRVREQQRVDVLVEIKFLGYPPLFRRIALRIPRTRHICTVLVSSIHVRHVLNIRHVGTDSVMPGFPVTKMPNPLSKNAKFEVLFTVSKKFKCQTVNTVDKILMPNSK